ncbi:LysM peptidoglycan-binding domain-containing protein [Streptomyces sp. SBST2-5]|uniref:LysM peptidoglycan-binding domain-containing protein n=1 Tax=Streptomyces composti TaxID=2720025 RepID=A0ABX1A0L1_9ACTN|nr:transglycosylase family protein [Streptomyces composti]NJP49953.1 LysM peptidoglycan-binding domain-containing protein [Streptomyces composti]
MLSGNGRHRRPRQAPALLVAAGVTGSAIAIPLLGASGASAADGETWDRVAECESGGSWSQNTGNGYYGGLQLTQDDWENYGGLEYAPSADQASRNQQIEVAERILADRGVGAWRACGLLSGLEQGSGAEETGAGTGSPSPSSTDAPESSGSSETSDESGTSRSADPSASSSPSPSVAEGGEYGSGSGGSSDPADASESPESGTSADADPEPSASETAGNGDESDKSGQGTGSSALTDTGGSSGTGRHRGPSAEEKEEGLASGPSGRHAARPSDDASGGSYTVRRGDSLWSIADSLEVDGGWRALYERNQRVVGDDPDLILPGQTLEVAEGARGE